MPDVVASRIGLNMGQACSVIAIGAALWFLAAVFLHNVAPMGALDGSARAISYAFCIPAIWPIVWLTQVTKKLRHD